MCSLSLFRVGSGLECGPGWRPSLCPTNTRSPQQSLDCPIWRIWFIIGPEWVRLVREGPPPVCCSSGGEVMGRTQEGWERPQGRSELWGGEGRKEEEQAYLG